MRSRTQALNERQPFPNLNAAAGQYDFWTQSIHLNSVTAAHMAKAIQPQNWPERFRVLPLVMHERQHFVDHITTLWGRQLLRQAFEVSATRNSPDLSRDLSRYNAIAPFYRELRTVHLDQYYTDEHDQAAEGSGLSVGMRCSGG